MRGQRFTMRALFWGVIAGWFTASVQARSYDDIVASGYLTVALYQNFPPYSFEVDGQPQGIDVAVARHIAQSLGVEPRWLWITADENLEDDMRNAIWKGHVITRQKADLMMRVPYDHDFSYATDGYGLPRNEMVVMFGPYHREGWALLRDTRKTRDIRTLALFQYEKVAVELDSLPDFFLGATLGGRLRNNLVHTTDVFAGIELLKLDQVVAVAGMRSQLEWGLNSEASYFDISADGLAAISVQEWDIGMAVQQDYRQLAYALEAVIESMQQDGRLASVFAEYKVTFVPAQFYAH